MSSVQCSLSRLDHVVSLAGDWEFQLDPAGALDVASIDPDRTIPVPLPWQAAYPELRRYAGYAWYRRSFEADGDLDGGDLRLRFGAVDYWCEVYLNGTRVAEHEGGYTPFEIGLRDALEPGRNEIAVRGYEHDKYRRLVWQRGVKPIIARRQTDHGSGLGRHRWVV